MTGEIEEFLVPDLGEGLEEATVVCWYVTVGDDVELNQTLCSLETAKAEVEIPSPYAGRIVELRGEQGETLDVGSLLARIDTSPGSAPAATPAPAAEQNGASVTRTPVLVGYGADDHMDTSRRSAKPPISEPPPARAAQHSRPRSAPATRKLAAELHVDLAALQPGSGPGGVISRGDVLAATGAPKTVAVEATPVRAVQARMAERMTLSRSQIPDAHASVSVDCTNLLAVRDRLRGTAGEDGAAVTPFVLTLRLLVIALTQHRVFNSTWVDGPEGPQVHTSHSVNLGFGVAAERGLLVPVVADAQRMTTGQLASRVSELISGARAGSLKPAELQGSTFTVSNFGALGLDDGVPVINYPEAAILGMGSLKPRPAVVDGAVVVRPTMTLTCVFDHRIADGAQVAQFLGEIRELIEFPDRALLNL